MSEPYYPCEPMPAPALTPQSVKQYLVTMGGLTAYWQKATAPKWMRNETQYNDGQEGVIRTHLDFVSFEKITLTKNYDSEKDGTIIDFCLERRESGERFEVTIQPVKPDKAGTAAPGKTLVLQDCQIVSVTYPSVDREGTGLSTLLVEIIPGDVVTQ